MIPESGRRAVRILLVAGGILGLIAAPTAADDTEFPYLSVDEIRPGMMGVGRTVFQGHVPEEFQVEILGVLKNGIGPQQDMILSRLHGRNVERTGVIAGMSGSPVMVEGKLIGAISYRLGVFEKEAIAGITPIADMLKAADFPSSRATADAGALLEEWAEPGEAGRPGEPIRVPGLGGDLLPIATPLVFGGFAEAAIRQAAPFFRARGLEPVLGGGSESGGEGVDYPVEPGVPVAAVLVRGDLSLAATGTLTHVVGDRIWAFGHPFLDFGPVRIPMSRAEILVTYPSFLGSFKISNATSPMGTLLQDRLTTIQGVLGPPPAMIPVTVGLETPGGRRRLAYEIFENSSITPVLVALTAQASLQRVLEFSAEATYRTELRIETEGHAPVIFSTVETDFGGLQSAATTQVARELGLVFNIIYNNRFEPARVKSVHLDVRSVPEAKLARIEDVSVTPSRVRPGESLSIRASVRPFRGEPLVEEFSVRVPPDTPPGPLTVVVASARVVNALEGGILQRRFVGASRLDQTIDFLNSLRTDDRLYLHLSRRGLGAVVQGETLPTLPLSILFTLASNRFAGEEYPAADLPVLETSRKSDYVLIGGRRTAIEVR